MAQMYVAVRHDMMVDTEDQDAIYDVGGRVIGVYPDFDAACSALKREARDMFECQIHTGTVLDYANFRTEGMAEVGVFTISICIHGEHTVWRFEYVVTPFELKET